LASATGPTPRRFRRSSPSASSFGGATAHFVMMPWRACRPAIAAPKRSPHVVELLFSATLHGVWWDAVYSPPFSFICGAGVRAARGCSSSTELGQRLPHRAVSPGALPRERGLLMRRRCWPLCSVNLMPSHPLPRIRRREEGGERERGRSLLTPLPPAPSRIRASYSTNECSVREHLIHRQRCRQDPAYLPACLTACEAGQWNGAPPR